MLTLTFGKTITIIISCCLLETVSNPVRDANYGFNFNPLPRQLFVKEHRRQGIPLYPQLNFEIQIPLPGPHKSNNKSYKNNNIDLKQIQSNAMLHTNNKVNHENNDFEMDLNHSDHKDTKYNVFKNDLIAKEVYDQKDTDAQIYLNQPDHKNIKYNVFKSEINEKEVYFEKEDDDIWATDTATEFATTMNNDYYESTTEDDVFNRMAAPSAVVASLLG